MSKPHVVVVGAGVSGLAAAHRLLELAPDWNISVLDGAPRTGGLIRTERIGGCLVEQGPDSIIVEKPAALQLAERLGLQSEVLYTNAEDRGAYVVYRGRLERIPEGFSMMAPSQAGPILRSPILSPLGKLRMAAELLVPRGTRQGDESVAGFVARRFGREVLERLAQPLMSGIYGTDASELSLRSTMPRFIELERKYGSVTLGLLLKQRQTARSQGARYALFFAFKQGNQTLTDTLRDKLAERVHLNSPVLNIRWEQPHYRVQLEHGAQLQADAVILAVPASGMARVLQELSPEAASLLDQIRFGSTATVAYAWPTENISRRLDAFGFVVPDVEHRRVIASTWASKKFLGRAPDGQALIRVFFGDRQHNLQALSDDELIQMGQAELAELIGARGKPLFASVARQLHAMPKYTLNHAARVDAIERALGGLPLLGLAGNSLYGVGIPDAIASGENAALRLHARLTASSAT
jgi:protoporphyrinogen/coproporphyrinogen III oxidase